MTQLNSHGFFSPVRSLLVIFIQQTFRADEFLNTDLQDNEQPIKPIPNTARSCKRFSGFRFKADTDKKERHGVMDSLIYWGFVRDESSDEDRSPQGKYDVYLPS